MDGEAGEQGPPALAVDTIQDGLLDVQVQQPAEGQEADMMATPGQPRQALEALSGSEVYQPEPCLLRHARPTDRRSDDACRHLQRTGPAGIADARRAGFAPTSCGCQWRQLVLCMRLASVRRCRR